VQLLERKKARRNKGIKLTNKVRTIVSFEANEFILLFYARINSIVIFSASFKKERKKSEETKGIELSERPLSLFLLPRRCGPWLAPLHPFPKCARTCSISHLLLGAARPLPLAYK
jgi:hypothetical protein